MGWLARLFGRDEKQVGASDVGAAVWERLSQSNSPRRGSFETLKAYRDSPWLHAMVKTISHDIASTSWQLFRVRRNGITVRMPSLAFAEFKSRQKQMDGLSRTGELEEVTDHPFLDLMAKANPKLTGLQARQVTQALLDLKGECFWLKVFNKLGTPFQYFPLPGHLVDHTPTPDKPYFKVRINGMPVTVAEEGVLWIKYVDPAEPYGRGVGTGDAMRDEIDIEEYAAETIKGHFYNRARPELLIGIKQDGVTRDQLERFASTFKQQHRGTLRQGGIHVHSGELTVESLQQTFKELELLKLRDWERDAFRVVFNIPPEIMGLMGSSNRATAHEAQKIYAERVLVPRLEALRSAFQERLIPDWDGDDSRWVVGYESPMPEDREFKKEMISVAPWAFTRGDIREVAGFRSRDEVDDLHLMTPGQQLVPPDSTGPEFLAPEPTSAPPAGERSGRIQVVKAAEDAVIEQVLASLDPQYITTAVQPEWADQIEKWGLRTLSGVGVTGQGFNMLNPMVLDHLASFSGTKIRRINDTTREIVRQSLAEGVRAGEGADKLAARIGGVFEDARGARAKMIARTEVTNSANFATHSAHQLSGVVSKRQWVPTPDDRVRDEHLTLGGEEFIVGVNEPFRIDGLSAMYPGEFGIAEHDINCRCSTVAVIENVDDLDLGDIDPAFATDKPKSISELSDVWRKSFEGHADSWETVALRAFNKGFSRQEVAARDAIRRVLG